MKLKKFDSMDCPIAQTLDVVGERWSLLILRDIFMGVHTFEGLRSSLGIARNILSSRLTRLLDEGILVKRKRDGRSADYLLSDKGLELNTVLIAISQWGEKHKPNGKGPRVIFTDRSTDKEIAPLIVQNTDGQPLQAKDIGKKLGPGSLVKNSEP